MWRAVPSACAILLLAGCGHLGEDDDAQTGDKPIAGITQRERPPSITAPLRSTPPKRKATSKLPRGVPHRADGVVDPAAARVVRRWSAALRRGEVARAAAYFAQPSKVQNGGSAVITLRSRAERLAFNVSLPCGAIPTHYAAARGFTIVTFRLTERVGGDCQGAAGNRARCAIRVRHGRISEWYRLADPPQKSEQDQPLSTIGGAV
jgi:hypothetical protein